MEDGGDAAQDRGQRSAQDTGTAPDRGDLSERLSALARDYQRQADQQEALERIVATAVSTVPGAEHASISLALGRRRVDSAAATSGVARRFDELQQETQQGPCLDAMFEHVTIRVDDLTSDGRWPALAARVTDLGVRSMLCFQLFVAGDDLGALNLLAGRPAAFTDESEQVGLLFASHAAVAMAQAKKLANVTVALGRRDLIGQAKGILMERFRIDADHAFALLTKLSQDTNRKLYDVAEELTITGAVPSGEPTRRPAGRPSTGH